MESVTFSHFRCLRGQHDAAMRATFSVPDLLLSLPAHLSTDDCYDCHLTASNLAQFKVRRDTMVRHGGPDWRWDLTRSINQGGGNSSAPRAPVPCSDLGIERRTWTPSPRAFR